MSKHRDSIEDDPISFEVSGEFCGHTKSITSIAIAKDAPNLMITGSIDGTLILWDLVVYFLDLNG